VYQYSVSSTPFQSNSHTHVSIEPYYFRSM